MRPPSRLKTAKKMAATQTMDGPAGVSRRNAPRSPAMAETAPMAAAMTMIAVAAAMTTVPRT